MTAPDPATTAFLAKLVGDRELEPGEWFGACLADAHDALEAARPLIEAEATARERQRIRQLAIEHDAQVMLHDDPTNPAHWCTRPFADLLDGGQG